MFPILQPSKCCGATTWFLPISGIYDLHYSFFVVLNPAVNSKVEADLDNISTWIWDPRGKVNTDPYGSGSDH